MKTIIGLLLLTPTLLYGADIFSAGNGEIVAVCRDDAEFDRESGSLPAYSNRLTFDVESNGALVDDIITNRSPYSLVGTNLTKNASPVAVVPDKTGGRRALFNEVKSNLATYFSITVTGPANLRSQLPTILTACIATNQIGSAPAVAKANGVLIPLVQLQLLEQK